MESDIRSRVENVLEQDESLVWVLSGHKRFQYSEGLSAEKYLEKVLLSVADKSSNSYELERWIRDWTSEYHLSRKRSQLLRGFHFDRTKKVLEVGCGCGAITRFLGETFDDVVSIEGSLARARLARLRTKGMENVSILCAPFQEIKVAERFDIIFCIGVFEYSRMFVDDPDPFDFILRHFHNLLKPDGEIFIAIENQFGLKYFSSSKEDHSEIMFDGLEGYPRHGEKEKTFGYYELKDILGKYFSCVEFYFPYPDYKTPSCILSERFLSKVKAGELVGRVIANSLIDRQTPLFDERLVLFELERNRMLPFFSNSFLAVAGKMNTLSNKMASLGLIYTNSRRKKYQAVTMFSEQDDGRISVTKTPLDSDDNAEAGPVTLKKLKSEWMEGLSIDAQVMKRVKERSMTLKEIFTPCGIWAKAVQSLSYKEGGVEFLEGKYLDCTWGNSFVVGGECRFIDLEWELPHPIPLNVLVIRSIYDFLTEISSMNDLSPRLAFRSQGKLIKRIASDLGFALKPGDFDEFCKLESGLCQEVNGKSYFRRLVLIKLMLWNKSVCSAVFFMNNLTKKIFYYYHAVEMKFRSCWQ